ncbi:MAG: ABC transporter permease [Gemmatimonadetes bacterium]|nr:ABC transporter permease [Gemmatimonadota bacterium]
MRPTAEAEADVDAELEFHIATRIDELVREGWTPPEARAEVLRRFGDPGRISGECKEIAHQRMERQEREAVVDGLKMDLKYAFRGLVRNPWFAAVVVATIGLGVGAATAIFTVVDHVMLRPLPYPDADRLVVVWETDRASGTSREPASVPDYFDLRERQRSFDGLAAYVPGLGTFTEGGESPEQLRVAQVTHTFGRVMGVQPIRGRFFAPEEDLPDAPPVTILSERLWNTRFGSDDAVVGRAIELDGELHTVVGVLPRVVDFPSDPDLWVSTRISPASALPRSNHRHTVVGRLSQQVTVARAQADMDRIMSELEEEYPGSNGERGANVEPLSDVLFGQVRASLLTLLGAVGLLLLIGCVNVANLLLARAAERGREVGVRTAMGASRGRLTRQFLVEGLVLSLIGTLLGVVVAYVGKDLLLAGLPDGLPRVGQVGIDGRVLGFAALLASVIGVVFGLTPALQAKSGANPSDLSMGARSAAASATGPRLRRGLVVAEVALSVMLVVGAALLMRSFAQLSAVDPGFRPESVLKVQYQLPTSRYPADFSQFPNFTEILDFNRTILDRVATLPGVVSAAVASNHPIEDGFTNSFLIEGREDEFESQAELPMRIVSPGYFETVGVPLLQGRVLTLADGLDSPPVLVINQAAADRYFPAGDAIGSRIGFWGAGFREIVGIVGNERFQGLDQAPPPAMYPSTLQLPVLGSVRLLIRTAGEPETALPLVREAFGQLDPALPLFSVETLDQALAESIGRDRFTSLIVSTFAAVALGLSLLGVYGILAYSIARRRAEIGVRVALGATEGSIARMVVGQGMTLVVVGTLLGLASAAASSRLLASQLFGVSPLDTASFVGVASMVLLVAFGATLIPASRAARTDPAVALQAD